MSQSAREAINSTSLSTRSGKLAERTMAPVLKAEWMLKNVAWVRIPHFPPDMEKCQSGLMARIGNAMVE